MLATGMKGRSPAMPSSEECGQPLPVGSEEQGPQGPVSPTTPDLQARNPSLLGPHGPERLDLSPHLTALHSQGEPRLHSPHLPCCVHISGWFPSLLTSLPPVAHLPSPSCSSPSELHLRGHEHFPLLREDQMGIRKGEKDAWVGNRKET